jgi:Putative beta-barrel porin-2, OmpL-like. bbp2
MSIFPRKLLSVFPGGNARFVNAARDSLHADPESGEWKVAFDSYVTWNPRQNGGWLSRAIMSSSVFGLIRRHPTRTAGQPMRVISSCRNWQTCAEYLFDRGGMFSGVNQALKETTVTLDWKVADGLVIRPEWRLDWSNRPSFLTDTLGTVSKQQNTPGFGLVWWFGGKEGAW